MKRILLFVLLVVVVLVAAACDDLNKPAQVPKSEPRATCFSDVECPGSKCVKGSGNDIQGHCASNGGGGGGGTNDAGAEPPTSEPAPPPSVKPAPGDIQL